MKPKKYLIPVPFKEKFTERQRATKLTQQLVKKLEFKDHRQLHFLKLWNTIKYKNYSKLRKTLTVKGKKGRDLCFTPQDKVQRSGGR